MYTPEFERKPSVAIAGLVLALILFQSRHWRDRRSGSDDLRPPLSAEEVERAADHVHRMLLAGEAKLDRYTSRHRYASEVVTRLQRPYGPHAQAEDVAPLH